MEFSAFRSKVLKHIRFRALRWGVDSLYLSYPGELFPNMESRLKELKQFAQSSVPDEVAKAQLPLGGHIFEVKEKGASLFPYIVEDGALRISLSRPGRKAPMAFAKVSAHYLAHVGPAEAERHLSTVLSELGEVKEAANVSRIDLFVDFVSNVDMESWDRHAWPSMASTLKACTKASTIFWPRPMPSMPTERRCWGCASRISSGRSWRSSDGNTTPS